MRRWILVVALMALVVAACSSDSGSTTDTGPVEGVDRCEELDPLVLDFLRGGLTVDASLPWGFSVKSGDYEDVWIVTAAVEADVLDEAAYGTQRTGGRKAKVFLGVLLIIGIVAFMFYLDRPGRLYIDTVPKDAKIRLKSPAPEFSQGMELKQGRYQVEVSAPGYLTKTTWIRVKADGNWRQIRLSPKPVEIPSIQATVTRVKLFAAEGTIPEVKDRVYGTKFKSPKKFRGRKVLKRRVSQSRFTELIKLQLLPP